MRKWMLRAGAVISSILTVLLGPFFGTLASLAGNREKIWQRLQGTWQCRPSSASRGRYMPAWNHEPRSFMGTLHLGNESMCSTLIIRNPIVRDALHVVSCRGLSWTTPLLQVQT